MKEAVIVSGNRTPIGTLGKTLKDISAEQLSSLVIEDIMQRTNIKGHLIDELYWDKPSKVLMPQILPESQP